LPFNKTLLLEIIQLKGNWNKIQYGFNFGIYWKEVKWNKLELIQTVHPSYSLYKLRYRKFILKRRLKNIIWSNIHSIFSSIGAFGWKTERARANSSKPSIPLCFVSNKSNTCPKRISYEILTTWSDKIWTYIYTCCKG
jgi:hypothetical protein